MRPVSPSFLQTLRDSHLVESQVELLFPDTLTPVTIPVEAGQVRMDRTAQIRRSGTVSIPWSLTAGSATYADLPPLFDTYADIVAGVETYAELRLAGAGLDVRVLPYGGYAILSRGVLNADGSVELCRLGVLRIESVSWGTEDRVASLELADRMAQVRDEPFTTPYSPQGGVGITRTGTLTDGSAVVTGLSSTTGLFVGQTVVGTGIPAGRTIVNVDSSSQITLSGPANITGTKTGHVTAGSKQITGITPDASDLSPGMVWGSLGVIDAVNSSSEVTLHTPVGSLPSTNRSCRMDGTDVIRLLSGSTGGIAVGNVVTGTGIPAGTTVVAVIDSTHLKLSNPAGGAVDTRNVHVTSGGSGSTLDSVIVDGAAGTAGLAIGMVFDPGANPSTNANAPANTTIVSMFGIEIRLSKQRLPYNATQIAGSFGSSSLGPNKAPAQFSAAPLTQTLTFSGETSTATVSCPASQSLTFGAAVTIAQAARDIVYAVFGDSIAYRLLYNPPIGLFDVFYSENRADALAQLAQAAGADAYFDANGDFVFDVPAGSTPSVWEINAGDDGVMVATQEALDRTGVYNGVLVSGQNAATDIPVSALVTDDDPDSPLRWDGPFGKVARIEQSTAVSTAGQAADAAQALLDRRTGLTRSLEVDAAPNPALEAGDVITVEFDDGRIEAHVIDTLTIGLEPGSGQEIACRRVPTAGVLTRMPRPRRSVRYGDDAWAEVAKARRVSA